MIRYILIILIYLNCLNANSSFDQINTLFKANQEAKALQKIDSFIGAEYSTIKVKDVLKELKPQKNRHGYYSYFFISLLKTKLNHNQKFDESIYKMYRYYISAAFWHDYYHEVKKLNRYMLKQLELLQVSDDVKRKFIDMIQLSNALYLISQDDPNGYKQLSKLKPLSKELKKEIRWLSARETRYTQNLEKLADTLGMQIDELGSHRSTKKEDIFFDLDGHKIYSK